ncbi:MAG TPA: DUF6152 family protein [Verrucomicrobiae bacterium]|nr:DUF6152 family protein [Verrucomicrobiae bacterium]
MRNKALGIFLAAMSLLAISAPLSAHHGTAGYDMDKQLVMKATVTDWLWANPHCFLTFDGTDDKGATVRWTAEVSNPVDMTKRGWSRRILNPGDQITVTVRPAKNGAPVGQLLKVILPNGQTLMGWNPPTR